MAEKLAPHSERRKRKMTEKAHLSQTVAHSAGKILLLWKKG